MQGRNLQTIKVQKSLILWTHVDFAWNETRKVNGSSLSWTKIHLKVGIVYSTSPLSSPVIFTATLVTFSTKAQY